MNIRKVLFIPLMVVTSALMAQERTRPLNPSIDSLFPSRPTAYLTDMANIVRNATEVNARLAVIRDSNQLSLVAVTLPSLGRFDVADVAREIGRSWMVATRNDTIGAAARNTGGVILISMSPRKCRVEVATGSEGYMTDYRAAAACRNAVAALKAGNFGNGIISIANEFVRYHNEELASQSAARAEAARPKVPPKPFPWNTVITIVSVLVILCLPVLYYLNKRQKELEELEKIERIKARMEAEKAVERQRVWQIEEDKRRAKEKAAQAERDRIAAAKEKARWDALTPEQQQAERVQRRKEEEETERQMAAARRKREADARAEEVAERIRRRHQDEEEAERRSHQTHYSSDSNSSSNNSSDSSYSSGGSDSFSGGGGGSDF